MESHSDCKWPARLGAVPGQGESPAESSYLNVGRVGYRNTQVWGTLMMAVWGTLMMGYRSFMRV